MWGTLIDYWSWSGDATYNDDIMASMQFQAGENKDYQPRNFTISLGNDDQAFWGMSAMLAAEAKFPDPPSDKPQWLALAQAVFNTQAAPERHDDYCGGGLHWQVPTTNKGYWYKNSIANGCFFNLGARLYRYTGNKTFSDWAIKTWDWMEHIGFLDNETYAIYDGANSLTGCKELNKAEFSYNNGVFAQGAAFLYNAVRTLLHSWQSSANNGRLKIPSGNKEPRSWSITASRPSSRTASPSKLHVKTPSLVLRICSPSRGSSIAGTRASPSWYRRLPRPSCPS